MAGYPKEAAPTPPQSAITPPPFRLDDDDSPAGHRVDRAPTPFLSVRADTLNDILTELRSLKKSVQTLSTVIRNDGDKNREELERIRGDLNAMQASTSGTRTEEVAMAGKPLGSKPAEATRSELCDLWNGSENGCDDGPTCPLGRRHECTCGAKHRECRHNSFRKQRAAKVMQGPYGK
jgi:hypothetical protein